MLLIFRAKGIAVPVADAEDEFLDTEPTVVTAPVPNKKATKTYACQTKLLKLCAETKLDLIFRIKANQLPEPKSPVPVSKNGKKTAKKSGKV